MPLASSTIRALIARTAVSQPDVSISRNRIPTVDDFPPGRDSIEVPAYVAAKSFDDAGAYARDRWGSDAHVDRLLRTATGAISSSDAGAPYDEFSRLTLAKR